MKRFLSVSFLFLLAACAPDMTPQQKAFLHELADRPVICDAGDDCDSKWNRAIEWVSRHSTTGIRTINDNLIATDMMTDGNRPPNRYPEFTVVRYASGKHAYRMDFTSYCDHGFICNPSAIKLRADFVTFVMGPPPGVTEVKPGVFQKKTSY